MRFAGKGEGDALAGVGAATQAGSEISVFPIDNWRAKAGPKRKTSPTDVTPGDVSANPLRAALPSRTPFGYDRTHYGI